MPYTPPSQLSPATSKQSTPIPSRSPSYINNNAHSDFVFPPVDSRPALPRSAGSSSYLTKHRRSPSTPNGSQTPEVMTDLQRGITFDPHGSLRASPPPKTNGVIPAGLTISPPESTHNSDDEDTRGRTREMDKENLAQLQAAIRSIGGERKSGSPVRITPKPQLNGRPASEGNSPAAEEARPSLSSAQRKISHSRSSTDSNIVFETSAMHINTHHKHSHSASQPALLSPRVESDSDESDMLGNRPPMVRKKSGELVKPALRPHSRRRPSSMPGTPTYSKAVHFDSQLEHIRHFLQVDRPLAVSAGSSPVENYESESEFPFGSDEASARKRGSSFEWEIRLANFPADTVDRAYQPIHVERVFLSSDKKNLVGVVAVQNLAFQKQVTARFTLDYWKTTSEVAAEFSNDVRRVATDNMDRFSFSISLADQNNLENKTLFFCVRYNVNGQEYWDSNNAINYQVDFAKRPRTKSPVIAPVSTLGARPLSALPRSRPSPPVSNGRPKSMPISFDDFGSNFESFAGSFTQSPTSLIGEPQIKLRSPRSKQELVPDAPARRNKSATPLFGHRYDFNSSLSAAKSNAYAVLGEQSGLPVVVTKQSPREVPVVEAKKVALKPLKSDAVKTATFKTSTAPAVSAPMTVSTPAAILSEKPALSSESYQELVDKYCFFGSAKSSPSIAKTAGFADGAGDVDSDSDASVDSVQTSGSWSPNMDQAAKPASIPRVATVTVDRHTKTAASAFEFPFNRGMPTTATSLQLAPIAG